MLQNLWSELFEEVIEDLCMPFFNYKRSSDDDVAAHVTCWKLEGTFQGAEKENRNLLLMCRIIETLPSCYFSFASSWRLLIKEH